MEGFLPPEKASPPAGVTAVFGASGMLGRRIVAELSAGGARVRAVSRTPSLHASLWPQSVEAVKADLRDPGSVGRACAGARTVVSTANGFLGRGSGSPPVVDRDGHATLVEAARAAAVRRFVFVSAFPASAESPVDFFRYKFATEQRIAASGLDYVLVRPTAFSDMWVAMAVAAANGGPPLTTVGKAAMPLNFVAIADVVHYIARAVRDDSLSRVTLNVGGPDNLTMAQLGQRVAVAIGKPVRLRSVPMGVARTMSVLLNAVDPVLARMIMAGIMTATTDLSFDMAPVSRHFGAPATPIDAVIAAVCGTPSAA
jgi:uncharacterized protein YbjT (DUF2867 family)